MIDKLEAFKDRFLLLEEQMSDPAIISNLDRYKKISKEYKDVKEIVEVYKEYRHVLDNILLAREMLDGEKDPEILEMAEMELEQSEARREELEEKIKYLLIPKDPEDTKDVIFEIRSGTGGDEASLFAGDLYRMYSKYFEGQGWTVEIVSINEGTVGGYNKIVLEISGDSVFGKLKFESGAHRVQRVPKTESQGRVHTSAATVVVMPKLEMEDVNINKADLKVDTFRSSGAGGQHVNKTESGVRFTHLPTGIVSESTDGRSQIKNREIALQRLYQKIYESQREQHESTIAAQRRSLVGSGDRSGKIRTYNFPQNRVTDHRINLTLYNLDRILEGELDGIIEALQLAENTEKLKAAEEEL
ncbi:MAG: peptide chain release factor 1 [Saprospiraceae bacterium]|nr:peptide chain release factor 1 [Saprospiraceae bacterium]MCB0622408.1 peptide chain release factor 1 [Saprospiraceae bacterium]MCB0677308.1 peptide chain release factor 1 [Saprospiraceae bacterium]MCB0681350.1 peptide chain release factor 1 [Saprospiraceae bacterium]